MRQLNRNWLCFVLLGIFLFAVCLNLEALQDNTSQILAALSVNSDLQPTKAVFLEIDRCRVQLSEGDLKQNLTQVEESLIEGLLIGWDPSWAQKWPAPRYVPLQKVLDEAGGHSSLARPLTSPPAIYLQSLKNDADVCNAIAPHLDKSKDSAKGLESVIRDLDVKFRDCYLHGMGRLIPIEIATKRGEDPDSGWTVYFKWVTVSDLPTTETAFRTSSTPAKDDLPAGVYQLRAEKSVPATSSVLSSQVKTVDLSGEHNKCELQVP